MAFLQHIMILLALLRSLIVYQCMAQSPEASSLSSARTLDALLQDYAYRAFVHPRTGIPFKGTVPLNLTGITIAALRLRSGSLKKRGVSSYEEFIIPANVTVNPHVERLVLVYQNLGNWTTVYYPLSGYSYLTPVLGLLAYDAANLSSTNLSELDLVASGLPISINFTNAIHVPVGSIAQCVWFGLDGSQEFEDMVSANVCSTYRQGHYSIVVNSTGLAPSPSPGPTPNVPPGPGPNPQQGKSNKSKVWKIVGGAAAGVIGLVLLAFLIFWIHRHMQKKKVTEMERRADAGVALRMAPIGNTQASIATGTRTQPILENEYIA